MRDLKSQVSNAKSGRSRLDQALVDRGLCESRERAQRAIVAERSEELAVGAQAERHGQNGRPTHAGGARTASAAVDTSFEQAWNPFTSTLRARLWSIWAPPRAVSRTVSLHEARPGVYAVDVGQGQLAWKLRRDPAWS